MAHDVTTTEHAFNRATHMTLIAALDVCDRRGAEYGDTWHADNLITTFLDATLRLLGIDAGKVSTEAKRLLLCAALIDVKDSRVLGPWKPDTVDDGINYRAAYRTFREELPAGAETAPMIVPPGVVVPRQAVAEVRALCREAEETYWSGDEQFTARGELTGTERVPSARLDALERQRSVVSRALDALGLQ